MKNNMKKIISVLLAFVFLFTGTKAFASVTWNTDPTDCPGSGIGIPNGTGGGIGVPAPGSNDCWSLTSVSGVAGGDVNVQLYYHNTGNQNATNTKAFIQVTPALGVASTTHTFKTYLTSTPTGTPLGTVTLNLNTAQSLSIGPNDTWWYPNQSSSYITSGAQITTSSGLYLGTIIPGWDGQGSIISAFHISNNQPQVCTINGFSASPTQITSGGSSILSWSTTGCTSISINPWVGNDLSVAGGSATTSPLYSTTTYTLTASNSNNSDTATATVNVSQPSAQMTGNIHITNNGQPNCIIASGSSTCPISLTWTTTNPVGVSEVTHNGNTVATGNNGTKTVGVSSGHQTYYLYNNEIELDSQTVIASCASGSTWTGTYCKPTTIQSPCEITKFSANPSTIEEGSTSTLSWSTIGCSSVKLDGSIVTSNGSRDVSPSVDTTYTLNAEDSHGVGVGAQVTVYVKKETTNACEIINFDASDTSIDEGESSTLEWETENCSRVKISHIGDVNDDGTRKVYPDSDTTYVLTAYDEDGSTETASVRIYVDEDNNDDSCTIDSFTASDTYIDSGDEVTLKWRTTGCDDEVYITNVGDVDEDGSEDVFPYRTTTYTLRARGNGDSDSESIKINVGSGGGVYNANVVTMPATNISQNSAQLNGLLTDSTYGYNYYNQDNTRIYFEYGTSTNLGMRTNPKNANGYTTFNDYVSGLSPKTIYYFRAVSEGSDGVSYGAIEVFQTLGYTNTYVNTGTTRIIREKVVEQGTTVISAESPVVLRIENRYQMIGVGDTIDYVVFYKNISNSKLSNPMAQVYIPEGITLVNYSAGSYSEDNRTLSVPLNDLYPDEEGVFYLQARVDSLDSNLAQMVTTAVFIYTTPNGAQENVMAYVLNNPKLTNVLGASVLGSGLFLGMNLVGWLLLITFILILILLVRTFYARRETVVSTIHHE